jgi:branched-chain amino acid transport system permease protein
MKKRSYSNITAVFVLLLLLLFMPRLVSEYKLNLVITMVIYSLFALSYNILFGQAGLLSFGHAAYFGVGAYATVLLIKRAGLGILPGIIGGGIAGAVIGLIFGIFIVRLSGTYFALLTLAFNALIYATAEKWRAVTGGEDGVAAQRPDLFIPGLGKIDMFSTVNWYYFVTVIVVICALYCWYFNKTPLGRLNLAMRENEQRSSFIGYNTYISKIIIYVLSAFFAGIAGSLAGAFQEFVTVTFINLDKASEVLIMTFIGGGGVYWGPILGACFLTYLNDLLSSWTENWTLIQGAIFIVLVMYAPRGISGLLVSLYERIKGMGSSKSKLSAKQETV